MKEKSKASALESNVQSAQNQILMCPRWPGRNPNADIRKANCSQCKAEVSVTACNLPQLVRDKIAIYCEECAWELCDKHEDAHFGGINLPNSGNFTPFEEE